MLLFIFFLILVNVVRVKYSVSYTSTSSMVTTGCRVCEFNRGFMVYNIVVVNFVLLEVIVCFEVLLMIMVVNMCMLFVLIVCVRTSSFASATSFSNFVECVFVVVFLMSFCVLFFFSDSVVVM